MDMKQSVLDMLQDERKLAVHWKEDAVLKKIIERIPAMEVAHENS